MPDETLISEGYSGSATIVNMALSINYLYKPDPFGFYPQRSLKFFLRAFLVDLEILFIIIFVLLSSSLLGLLHRKTSGTPNGQEIQAI